jgi:hypothetical protein
VRNPLARAVGLIREGAIGVDLQWRSLPRHELWPPSIAADLEAAVEVDVAGRTLRTLPDAAHLRFASIHAIVHKWARFKWLIDFGAVARRLGIEQHAAIAVLDGLGRPTEIGLDVLDIVVGTAGAPTSGGARRALAAMSLTSDAPHRRGASWLYQLEMADRLGDKARVLARVGLRFVPGLLPTVPPASRPPSPPNRSTGVHQP